jgi:RND family efflux transporter MFP subunit
LNGVPAKRENKIFMRVKKVFYQVIFFFVPVIVAGQLLPGGRLPAQEVLVVQPAKRDITLTGYTRSQTAATLSSEVAGRILKINYDVGQLIGDPPFLTVDPTFIDLEITGTRHSLDQLKISQKKRQSRVAFFEKEFRRIDKLFKRGSSPESRRDTLKEDLDQARFDLKAVGIEIAIAQTRLQELQERKSRHAIYAPAGWFVVAKLVEEGELLTVNTPVARVADYEHLVVPLSVSSEELAAIQRLGSQFDILLDGKPAKAAIGWINPEFDEKTRKLSIELNVHSYPGPRRGGLLCRLALQTETEGLWVPKQAVVSRYENPRVFLNESGAEVKVLVLGQTESHLIIANDPRLPPETVLRMAAAAGPKQFQEPGR